MNAIEVKLVEHAAAKYRLSVRLEQSHARWLRGWIGRQTGRVEFHQHDSEEGLVYRHPLIRYDVSGGDAVVAGLAEGAMLLRGLPAFEEFTLGGDVCRVLDHRVETGRVEVGPTDGPIGYRFRSPYLALNQENYGAWERESHAGRRRLLERIAVGNMLSLSKAIGLHVGVRIEAEVDLEPDGEHDLKPGVRLLGFRGGLRINFALPDGWGIGKSSARGFGTLVREEV